MVGRDGDVVDKWLVDQINLFTITCSIPMPTWSS